MVKCHNRPVSTLPQRWQVTWQGHWFGLGSPYLCLSFTEIEQGEYVDDVYIAGCLYKESRVKWTNFNVKINLPDNNWPVLLLNLELWNKNEHRSSLRDLQIAFFFFLPLHIMIIKIYVDCKFHGCGWIHKMSLSMETIISWKKIVMIGKTFLLFQGIFECWIQAI